jgi:hypothetical protein
MRDRPVGQHAIGTDGVANFTCEGSIVIGVGASDVRFREGNLDVTSRFCPWYFVVAPGEREVAAFAGHYLCKKYAERIFGLPLISNVGESDRTDAFINAYKLAFPGIISTECYFHVQQNVGSHTKSIGKKFKRVENRERAKHHVAMLHQCKSKAQFDVCLSLYLDDWRGRGEEEAAEAFQQVYGSDPYCNFFQGASKVRGNIVSGSAQESYHSELKGSKRRDAIIPVNVSRQSFFNVSIPKLMEDIVGNRNGGKLVVPGEETRIPRYDAVAYLMNPEVDLKKIEPEPSDGEDIVNVYWANCPQAISKPITEARLVKHKAAIAGDSTVFHSNDGGGIRSAADVASHMINTSNSLCRIIVDGNGVVIGDCFNCSKKLICGACVLVRDQLGQYRPCLKELVRSIPAKKRGRAQNQKLGGLCKGLRLVEPEDNDQRYLATLCLEDLEWITKEAGIASMMVSGISKSEERQLLVQELVELKHGKQRLSGLQYQQNRQVTPPR